jgi:hypothetical protein
MMGQIVSNINTQWNTPYDMRALEPEILPFLANMFLRLEVTPFSDDQFIFAGFTYFVDNFPTTQAQVFMHTESVQKSEQSNLQKVREAYIYLKKFATTKWRKLKQLSFLRKQKVATQ